MQVSNEFVLIAKDSTTDELDKMVSYFKLIDNFIFDFKEVEFKELFNAEIGEKSIIVPATYVVASSWRFDDKTSKDMTFTISASFVSPEDEVLTTAQQTINVPKGSDKMRVNFGVQGLPVKNSGRYFYNLEITGGSGKALAKGSCPLNVEINTIKD